MRIDLPNGQWAELHDPSEVTERQRRPIGRAMRGVRPEIAERSRAAAALDDIPDPDRAGQEKPGPEKEAALRQLQYDMTDEEADAYQDAGDLCIVALVESWPFVDKAGEPIPVTLDGLLDLPGHALDALRRQTAPLVDKLFLDTSPDPNPKAPTGGSNGSATTSEEAPRMTSLASGVISASSGPGSA